MLVNYWWRDVPAHLEAPMNALVMAMLALRELPAHQREGWQALFQHYIFDAGEDVVAHIPPHARRMLGPLDATRAADLREKLRQRLKR